MPSLFSLSIKGFGPTKSLESTTQQMFIKEIRERAVTNLETSRDSMGLDGIQHEYSRRDDGEYQSIREVTVQL